MLLLLTLTCAVILLSLSSMDNNTVRAQQQQTSLGLPITIIPGLTQNVLTIVSFLIGTSSFILGLRMQNVARIPTESTSSSSPTILSSMMNKYFELLILALVGGG